MEALLILFAPLIEICLAPVVALAGAIFSLIVELIALLLGLLFGSDLGLGRKRKRRGPLIPKKLVHWSAGTMLVLGLVGMFASYLFFDQILRYGLSRAEARTGVEITFERSAGNLLKGEVALEGITMRRASEEGLGFNIVAERVAVDVVLRSLFGEPQIQTAEVIGVRGQVSPPVQKDDEPSAGETKRRAFTADVIRVEDVDLTVQPKGGASYLFEIGLAEVVPFRSRTALFDLLFRSNMQAAIAGQSLSVETARITDNGRATYWRFEEIEAEKLKLVVPRAPLSWLEGGTVNAQVDDRWSLSQDWIEMDWKLSFRDVEVVAPKDAGLGEKALASGFAKILKARGGSADFSYSLAFDERQIAVARSGDLAGFWDIVADGLIGGAKTDEAKQAAEKADGKIKGALEKMKGLLNRDRDEN